MVEVGITPPAPLLQLRGIKKSFGATEVLSGIDLAVTPGEFITLLGPSGCGKTTTLRIIAGLESPDSGSVLLDGRDVTSLSPNRRDVNTVFQSFALFPHMSVEANVGYSLRLKRRPKAEIRRTVEELLELVQLQGFEKRFPSELSGGQSQRVAIARAVANRPRLLLLDEPLGALDLQLRRQMQVELKRLQKQLGIAFIYITHDQEEALSMSDRVAVMRAGTFEQMDTVTGIYDRPRTSYVARFVGSANVLRAECVAVTDGVLSALREEGSVAVKTDLAPAPGTVVTLAVRSEHVKFAPLGAPQGGEFGLRATVTGKIFAGGQIRVTASLLGGDEITSSRLGIDDSLEIGQDIWASWEAERAVLVDTEATT
jgi:spermidine/putrescine transport system ATP-binding protein